LSSRRGDYPFSITVFEDGVAAGRLSTCCEHRYAPGSRLGGPTGHFRVLRVDGGEPCLKCELRAMDPPNVKSRKSSKIKAGVIPFSSSRNLGNKKNIVSRLCRHNSNAEKTKIKKKRSKKPQPKTSSHPREQFSVTAPGSTDDIVTAVGLRMQQKKNRLKEEPWSLSGNKRPQPIQKTNSTEPQIQATKVEDEFNEDDWESSDTSVDSSSGCAFGSSSSESEDSEATITENSNKTYGNRSSPQTSDTDEHFEDTDEISEMIDEEVISRNNIQEGIKNDDDNSASSVSEISEEEDLTSKSITEEVEEIDKDEVEEVIDVLGSNKGNYIEKRRLKNC
ncbi:unnamed protein product, partial [Meganyctiphanes norvegica]